MKDQPVQEGYFPLLYHTFFIFVKSYGNIQRIFAPIVLEEDGTRSGRRFSAIFRHERGGFGVITSMQVFERLKMAQNGIFTKGGKEQVG